MLTTIFAVSVFRRNLNLFKHSMYIVFSLSNFAHTIYYMYNTRSNTLQSRIWIYYVLTYLYLITISHTKNILLNLNYGLILLIKIADLNPLKTVLILLYVYYRANIYSLIFEIFAKLHNHDYETSNHHSRLINLYLIAIERLRASLLFLPH